MFETCLLYMCRASANGEGAPAAAPAANTKWQILVDLIFERQHVQGISVTR